MLLYSNWHKQVVKKVGVIPEPLLYLRTLACGLVIFTLMYVYTVWLKIPNPLNKAVADTAIILIGLSMLLSSLCYFWDFVDTKIVYRKHLGLIGFAFGLVHIGLSFPAVQKLFQVEMWKQGAMWPMLTGALAAGIFALMAIVSNRYAAHVMGGKNWRNILRVGYLAVGLVFIHVYLLKWVYIARWIQGNIKTLPPTSVLVLVFMTIVLVMRSALWITLHRRRV